MSKVRINNLRYIRAVLGSMRVHLALPAESLRGWFPGCCGLDLYSNPETEVPAFEDRQGEIVLHETTLGMLKNLQPED